MLSGALIKKYVRPLQIVAAVVLLGAAAPGRASAASKPGAAGAPAAALSQQCRFREASPAEKQQFHNEFARNGWPGAALASVPRGYARVNRQIQEVGTQFATLYGDLDGDRKPEWVVGCYLPPGPGAAANASGMPALNLRDDRARIGVFKQDRSGRWKLHWQSAGLGFEFRSSQYNVREVQDELDILENLRLPLALVDINRDGRLEIAYYGWSVSAAVGALPGVLRYDGGKWVSVAPQGDRFSLVDLDGDRTLEVVTGSRYIGYGAGDDDVPRVWRWTGKQYREASRDFPRFYAGLALRYQAYVRRMEANGREFNRVVWDRAIQKANSLSS